jgi:hypothetical protein
MRLGDIVAMIALTITILIAVAITASLQTTTNGMMTTTSGSSQKVTYYVSAYGQVDSRWVHVGVYPWVNSASGYPNSYIAVPSTAPACFEKYWTFQHTTLNLLDTNLYLHIEINGSWGGSGIDGQVYTYTQLYNWTQEFDSFTFTNAWGFRNGSILHKSPVAGVDYTNTVNTAGIQIGKRFRGNVAIDCVRMYVNNGTEWQYLYVNAFSNSTLVQNQLAHFGTSPYLNTTTGYPQDYISGDPLQPTYPFAVNSSCIPVDGWYSFPNSIAWSSVSNVTLYTIASGVGTANAFRVYANTTTTEDTTSYSLSTGGNHVCVLSLPDITTGTQLNSLRIFFRASYCPIISCAYIKFTGTVSIPSNPAFTAAANDLFANAWAGLTLASIGIIITAGVGILALVLTAIGKSGEGATW